MDNKSKSDMTTYISIGAVVLLLILIGLVVYNIVNVNNIEKDNKLDDPLSNQRRQRQQVEKRKENSFSKGKPSNQCQKNDDKQVFNVGENIYTYNEAQGVCKAFGAELANYEQLINSYNCGGDWCNYGWSKGQMALYPTQMKSWLNLQDNDDNKDACGMPGVNGGYFENKDFMFGVNCYGKKPPPRDHEKLRKKMISDKERRLSEQVSSIRNKINGVTLLPFNKDIWSNC
jgi:hypothetical protein